MCGNRRLVKDFFQWLSKWKEVNLKSPDSHERGVKQQQQEEEEEEYYGKDVMKVFSDDSEGEEESRRFPNTFLLEGPVGTGKSALVYACAEELGFDVIEVNASQVGGWK